ncbi:MAG: hypothetical protein JJE10_00270 [Thermoleophilia bacterium]|nr:hypothetical protein [Thermoleophilia bacterium]
MKPSSIEILDPGSGLFVSLTAGGSGAIMLGDEVIAAAPIPPEGLDRLADGPLSLETERGSLEVEIESEGEPVVLTGELVGKRESRLARIRGQLVDGDRRIDLDCSGVLHAEDAAAPPGPLRRDATIILADGGLISLAGTRAPGITVHGEEEAAAAISHPGGYVEFGEVLLSTEYDSAGRHRRATLELVPATDEIAGLHGAGTVVAGCTAKVEGARINTALFRWSLDGHLGMGRYEIRQEPEELLT